jgi:hypothetical protein
MNALVMPLAFDPARYAQLYAQVPLPGVEERRGLFLATLKRTTPPYNPDTEEEEMMWQLLQGEDALPPTLIVKRLDKRVFRREMLLSELVNTRLYAGRNLTVFTRTYGYVIGADNAPFLLMEHVPYTFTQAIALQGSPLTLSDLESVMMELLAVVCEARKTIGFMHGDLHDKNIMFQLSDSPRTYAIQDPGNEDRTVSFQTASRWMPRLIDYGRSLVVDPKDMKIRGQLKSDLDHLKAAVHFMLHEMKLRDAYAAVPLVKAVYDHVVETHGWNSSARNYNDHSTSWQNAANILLNFEVFERFQTTKRQRVGARMCVQCQNRPATVRWQHDRKEVFCATSCASEWWQQQQ